MSRSFSLNSIKSISYFVFLVLLSSAVARAEINDPLLDAISVTDVAGAKPLIQTRLKITPGFGPGNELWETAVVRNLDMYKLHMENGQDVMMNEDPDEMAEWLKLVADNLDLYDLLLQPVRNPRQLERFRAELFLHAILEGHSPVVDLLLARGYPPTVRTDTGATPLMLAAGEGNLTIMQALVDKGASVNERSMTESALTLAIFSGGPKAVAFLIDAGADVNLGTSAGEPPLFVAVRDGNLKAFNLLVPAGIKFNVKTRWGRTPLMEAVAHGKDEMLQPLIDGGADVNAGDIHGNTALMLAARGGQARSVEFLLKHKADVNARNADGLTALMYAVTRSGNGEVISALLGMGADVEDKTAEGKTAILLARSTGHPEYEPLLK